MGSHAYTFTGAEVLEILANEAARRMSHSVIGRFNVDMQTTFEPQGGVTSINIILHEEESNYGTVTTKPMGHL